MVGGCSKDHRALGFCQMHYAQYQRGVLKMTAVRTVKKTGPMEWPIEVLKIDGVWHRRPTGSSGSWVPVVWAKRVAPSGGERNWAL